MGNRAATTRVISATIWHRISAEFKPLAELTRDWLPRQPRPLASTSDSQVQLRLPERAKQFDLGAAIHDNFQARILSKTGGGFVTHPDLTPQNLGVDRDRLLCNFHQVLGAAKDLNHVYRPINGRQRRVHLEPPNFIQTRTGVDR